MKKIHLAQIKNKNKNQCDSILTSNNTYYVGKITCKKCISYWKKNIDSYYIHAAWGSYSGKYLPRNLRKSICGLSNPYHSNDWSRVSCAYCIKLKPTLKEIITYVRNNF